MALDKFLREDLKMNKLKTKQCIYVRFLYIRIDLSMLSWGCMSIASAGTTRKAITSFKQQIVAKYECKALRALDRILNMEVMEYFCLSQFLYIHNILGRFKLIYQDRLQDSTGPRLQWIIGRIRLDKNGPTHMRFKPKDMDILRRGLTFSIVRWLGLYCC